jgi:hypothetical protein
VDRGALDAALALGFPCGGWGPVDRRAEDGLIPARYPIIPMAFGGYRSRTRKNVVDSRGTVILAPGALTGESLLTLSCCQECGKSVTVIDALRIGQSDAATRIAAFVLQHSIGTLNVAGPRASRWSEGHEYAYRAISGLLVILRRPR